VSVSNEFGNDGRDQESVVLFCLSCWYTASHYSAK